MCVRERYLRFKYCVLKFKIGIRMYLFVTFYKDLEFRFSNIFYFRFRHGTDKWLTKLKIGSYLGWLRSIHIYTKWDKYIVANNLVHPSHTEQSVRSTWGHLGIDQNGPSKSPRQLYTGSVGFAPIKMIGLLDHGSNLFLCKAFKLVDHGSRG